MVAARTDRLDRSRAHGGVFGGWRGAGAGDSGAAADGGRARWARRKRYGEDAGDRIASGRTRAARGMGTPGRSTDRTAHAFGYVGGRLRHFDGTAFAR